MKKILSVLLAAALICALCAACGGNKTTETVQVSATMAPTDTPAPTPEPTAEPTATPEPTAEPEATDAPEATEAPAEQGAAETTPAPAQSESGNSDSNSNSNANTEPEPTAEPTPEPTAEPVQDPYSVASGMIGQSVDALYNAIGWPNSSNYGSSCLVIGADDGVLSYGGFTVFTIRYSDGSETIVGVA